MPGVLLGALTLAGCDLPTQAPKWNTTWILPINDDTVRVAQFLPSSVDTAGGAFVTSVKRDSVTESLGQMCPGCAALDGTTASLPSFTVTLTHTDSFPAQVLSITPGAGLTLAFRMDNGLGFDPLRPGAGQFGHIVTVISDSAGNPIASDSLDGADTSFASGTSLTRTLSLGSSPIGGHVTVAAAVSIPGSDPVLVDTSSSFRVVTLTDTVALAGVTVQLTNQNITSDSVSVDWSNIDSDIRSKMQGATLQLKIENPFSASGSGTVSFKQGGVDVIPPKAIAFAPGSSVDTVGITQQQIQDLSAAGQSEVTVSASVTGTGPGQSVTITPVQIAVIQAHVLITILVGGD
jgi:hypothetical protein